MASMTDPRLIPVIVGVGDVRNRSTKVEDAVEPMQLMLEAIQLAINDTKLPPSVAKDLQSSIDSIDVVATWTWPYPDLPGLLSRELGVQIRHKSYSTHGGNQPGKMFDEAARRVSLSEAKVAILTGGEALASLGACAAAKKMPPPGWTRLEETVNSVFAPDLSKMGQNLGSRHSIGLPIHVYPLFENGFRARRGQSVEQNNRESAQLYAEFAKVAEKNPLAWNYGQPAATEQTIGTVTKRNRMICSPYPLLMNAFNAVNLATCCLLTSTEYATKLGIPESQWVYPLGGAGCAESSNFWERPNYHSSPSISKSIDAALEVCGLTKDEIDLFDFYSCFPIVPKLACQHLGFSTVHPPKPITLLGGLTSFGGAGNNYSMHAITAMTRELRKGKSQRGLVLANGGVMTYQHVVCLSSQPRSNSTPYPDRNPLPDLLSDDSIPPIAEQAHGEVVIETYTVEFKRDGTPLRGYVVGRLQSTGHRFVANHADTSTLQQLASMEKEQIGRSGWVQCDSQSGRNLFSFEDRAKL